MAVPPIDVRATWTGDELSTGALGAKADLEALGTAADTAATDINTSLSSVSSTATTEFAAVGTAADSSAVDLTTKASKFKAVGTELGTELAQGVSSGVDPATSVVNVGSSLSGLLAASAGTAGGAAAAIGLGLGVALIKNMIDGAKEKSEAFIAVVDETFNAIEVNASSSLKRIQQDIIEAFTTKEAIDQLKDLGLTVTEIEDLTRDLGLPFNEVVEIIRGDLNPSNRETYRVLQNTAALLDTQLIPGQYNLTETQREQKELAQTILGLGDERVKSNREAYGWARLEKEAMQATAGELGTAAGKATLLADESERARDAMREAERAAYDLGVNVGNAARQAANLALNLSGAS